MRTMNHRLITCALVAITLFFATTLSAQTTGNLSISTKTVTYNGSYGPKHVLAIWVESSTGTFIQTLYVTSNSNRNSYLNSWATKSGNNTVNATTGATRFAHGTLNVSWGGKNTSGTVVADGNYNVKMQLTEDNNAGKLATFPFVKGASASTTNPATQATVFTTNTLTWTPAAPVVGCTSNLVSNGDFEVDMTGWVNFTGIPGGWAGVTPAVRSTAQKANGVASASIASQWGGCVQKVITGITAGKSYTLNMNIMAPVATASQIVDLAFYNASNVQLATYPISSTSTSFSPYTVTGVAPTGTAYALIEIYSDNSGFFIDDVCLTQVVGAGVSSSKSNALQIYPSLVSEILNIKLENQNSATISIFNTTGQEMYKQRSNEVATGLKINLSNLNHGMYLVKVQAGNETYSSKFIKE